MAAHTGGIWGWLGVSAHITDRERVVRQLYLTTKFLDGHAEQALSLMEELLFELDVGRVERVAEGLIQARAAQRSSLAWMAPHFTSLQGARGVSPEGWLSDQLAGVPRLGRIERLAKGFENRDATIVDELSSELKIVSELLRRSPHLSACFTGSTAERETSRSRLKQWSSEAPATDLASIPWAPRERIERVGLAAPMDVAFCAFVLPGLHPADAQSEAVSAGAQHFSLHWVLDEIRLKGAAYGAGCTLDLFHRALQFTSYDDPNPARTLGVFESASARLRELEWTQASLDRTLITLAKDSLEPNRPGEATNMALSWHVLGVNDDLRTERYQALLGVSAPQAKAALVEMLERGADRACACVAGNRAELERVNLALGERALSIEELVP
jgi:hypothetical protein